VSTGGAGGSTDARAATDASDAPLGTPLSELSGKLADAACAALEACASSAIELVLLGEDCHTYFTNVLSDSYAAAIETSVAAGSITYDPVRAEECVTHLLEAATEDPPRCAVLEVIAEQCKAALGGLGDAGDDCTHRYECAGSLKCDLQSGCPGTCVALGKSGAPCVAADDCDPIDGLYCRMGDQSGDAGAAGTCTRYVARGQACTASGPACETGTLCVGQACRPVTDLFTAADGFGCYTTGTLCEEGLSCEFAGLPFLSTALCTAKKTPLDPCRVSVPDACPDGYYCTATLVNPQCVALPSENQACATGTMQNLGLSPPCAAGLACVGGFCKVKKRIGEACEEDIQCYGGRCADPGGSGAVCVPTVCP
jgi:hypothetical protein